MSDFVLLTTQRTGSTWLSDLLRQQEGLEAFGELFLPKARRKSRRKADDFPRFVEWKPGNGWPRRLQTFAYCDGLYARPGSVGFKLMYSQLRYFPELLLYFKRRQTRIIHLVRTNDLNVIISRGTLRATGIAHRRKHKPAIGKVRIRLDPTYVVREIRRLQGRRARARRVLGLVGLPFVECCYEKLVSDPAEFESVVRYLGVRQRTDATVSSLRKTRTWSNADAVENFGAVERALAAADLDYLLE